MYTCNEFWAFHHFVLRCLFPKALEMEQLQYLSLERETFLAWEERIFPLEQ